MPNGISCLGFAVRNYKNAQVTNNPFRTGIAAIQSVRTAEAASHIGAIQNSAVKPALPYFSKITSVLRKLVYPLIIGSGIYTTIKSDDKVKTGASQATGISSMYIAEKIVEPLLKNIDNIVDNKVSKMGGSKGAKALKFGWYAAKGIAYMTASITGFKGGSKIAEKIVDKIRNSKAEKSNNIETTDIKNNDVFKKFP